MEAAKAKKRPLPLWFLECPEEVLHENFYMNAFYDLGTTRQLGEMEGPIPWNRIMEYSDRKRFDQEMETFFARVMRSMDVAYLKFQMDDRRKIPPPK